MESYSLNNHMPEKLRGTKTEQNLHTALSGESQAHLRYTWFSKKAKDDGFIEVSRTFDEIAANEKEHAEIWFKYLGGWSSTEKNLESAANGEHFEWSSMYSEFASTAREEGFESIAAVFDMIGSIEKSHEAKYSELKNDIVNGKTFSSDKQDQKWICLNCGFVVSGKEPPKICPACSHAQGYFKKQSN